MQYNLVSVKGGEALRLGGNRRSGVELAMHYTTLSRNNGLVPVYLGLT